MNITAEVWTKLIECALIVVFALIFVRYITGPLFQPKADTAAAREGYEAAAKARDDAVKRRSRAELDCTAYEQMIINAGATVPWPQPSLPPLKSSSPSSPKPSTTSTPPSSSSGALSAALPFLPLGGATPTYSDPGGPYRGSTQGPPNA